MFVGGGHDVIGATAPSKSFLFAEGTFRPGGPSSGGGFVEYLTIQNPGATAATATVKFQASTDANTPVSVPDASQAVAANSRVTFNLNAYLASKGLAPPLNVSVAVSSDQPLVVERPIYFEADPGVGRFVSGGTTVVGFTG
jgi:hypothetical protein